MKRMKKILLLIMVIGICVVLYFKIFAMQTGTRVITWDNIYNENNLTFFYEDKEAHNNTKLKGLDETYNVTSLVSSEEREIKKVLKTTEILNT